ncbi:hypothetical protein [Kitasatospora sp. NPDC088346]|uniref:hypothetical protein n=1 Tax=Kitasatospora sp. NPDC088346 TaxID=3364073 RepID=UPI00380A220F
MNTASLLTAGEPEDVEPLLEVVNGLLHEVCVFGRMCRLWGDMDAEAEQKERVRYFMDRRHKSLGQITAVLGDAIGLRFADTAHLPYRHIQYTWPPGQPLAGYVSTTSGVSPYVWLSDFFSHWWMLLDEEFSEDGHFLRVLRSALWVCDTSGLCAALDYVADLVVTGQVVEAGAAAKAAVYLLVAGSRTDSPQELVASITGGRLPQSREEWLVFYPALGDLEGFRLSREAGAALESLVVRGWSLVEHARAATSLDEWLSSLAALEGFLKFVGLTASLVVSSPSTALRAILSQFEEIVCDITVAWVDMELDSGPDSGMRGFLRFAHGVEESLTRQGDTASQRFRRERLLLPPSIYSSSADSLPPEWNEPPTWRIAVAWEACHGSDPSSAPTSLWPAREPDMSEGLPLQGTHLRQALALHPERPQNWQALASALLASGWPRAADAAFAVADHMLRCATFKG